MNWIGKLEEYFDDIVPELQSEVQFFLNEYYEKKDTHSADSLGDLTETELSNLLYLYFESEKNAIPLHLIQKCKKLKVLTINAPIEDFSFLKELHNLKVLNIWGGRIYNFTLLKSLYVFCLEDNATRVDLSQELSNNKHLLFCSITSLENSFPSISTIPVNIPNVIEIELINQEIKKIPDLQEYKNLVSLDLTINNITEIPSSIKFLYKLKSLNVSNNGIKHLPKEMFSLSNLEYLNFADNQIEALPREILSLTKLRSIFFNKNPYKTDQIVEALSDVTKDFTFENQMPILRLLNTLDKPANNSSYNYVNLKIPQNLQTPMLQYFEFFKDYVVAAKGKNIVFDIKRDEQGLTLVTNGNTEVSLPELGNYFAEYVKVSLQNPEDWIFGFERPVTAMQADILRLKMENQIGRLQSDIKIAKLESEQLASRLADKQAENDFLKGLSDSLNQKIDVLIGKKNTALNIDQLLLDLQDAAVRMLERKHSRQLEDLHNDILVDFLRQKGYIATDQTRSGRSKLGVGEIDVMIRKKDGTPFSIIEAFRLDSCGEKNKIIAEHIDKLLHHYDTAGHARNFIMVYAEAKNFERLWRNYQKYVGEINGKKAFRADYPLVKFAEKIGINDKSSIKIGLATHRRDGKIVEVYHLFVNMFA